MDIINPKEKWPNRKAIATSVGAIDILKKTKLYSSLKDASNNYDIIYATTARRRDINKKHLSFKQFIKSVKKIKIKRLVFYLDQKHQVYLMRILDTQIIYLRYQ